MGKSKYISKKKTILADLSLKSERKNRSLTARLAGKEKTKGHIPAAKRTKELSSWRKEWFGWEGRKDGKS